MVTLANRAKMTTPTTGTGTITLGAASDGYQSFSAAGVTDGQSVRYVIEDGAAWEIGTGVYTDASTTLSRTVIESSNADAAINLTGSATVFISLAAGDIVQNISDLGDWPADVSATEVGYLDGVTSAIQTQLNAKPTEADVETAAINAQVGTTYTLALTDRGQFVTMDNASANTVTVPTNAAVAFDVGSVVTVIQKGAGATTVTGDTGVTVNGTSGGSVAILARYQGVSLIKVTTDTWIASGAV